VFKLAGIIDQGADGKKRIKMYTDAKGNFNGEALIVFFKKDSIALAINYQNDYWFRANNLDHKIYVKEADFSFKHNKDSEQIVSKLTRKDKKASELNRADLNR
jgi:HIV Tat-specific factor 1